MLLDALTLTWSSPPVPARRRGPPHAAGPGRHGPEPFPGGAVFAVPPGVAVARPTDMPSLTLGVGGNGNVVSEHCDLHSRIRHAAVAVYPCDYAAAVGSVSDDRAGAGAGAGAGGGGAAARGGGRFWRQPADVGGGCWDSETFLRAVDVLEMQVRTFLRPLSSPLSKPNTNNPHRCARDAGANLS